jgi:hypothetical protein
MSVTAGNKKAPWPALGATFTFFVTATVTGR